MPKNSLLFGNYLFFIPTAYCAISSKERRRTKSYKESSSQIFAGVSKSLIPAQNSGNLKGFSFRNRFPADEGSLYNSSLTNISLFLVVGCPFNIGRTFDARPSSCTRAKVFAPLGPAGRTVLGPCS